MDTATAAYWRDRAPSAIDEPPAGVDHVRYRYVVWYAPIGDRREATAGPTAWLYSAPVPESGRGLLHDVIAWADGVAAEVVGGVLVTVTLQRALGQAPRLQVRVMVEHRLGPRKPERHG